MAEKTEIAWCDSTFNSHIGCSEVSPACDNCYAREYAKRFHIVEWGPGKPRFRTSAANWKKPLQWNAQPFCECMSCHWRGEARAAKIIQNPDGFYPPVDSIRACPGCGKPTLIGSRRRVFCASLADVFDNEVPTEWRADLWTLIRATPNLDWLLLTKRVGNVLGMMYDAEEPLPNVWIGATICNQEEADRDIPKLLAVPAAVRFISVEPMLGPVDLRLWEYEDAKERSGTGTVFTTRRRSIDWIIVGGESGPNARPMHPAWPRSLRDQCAAAGVPFIFKQWGEWAPATISAGGDLGGDLRRGTTIHMHAPGNPEGFFRDGDAYVSRVGKKSAGRLLDGVMHNEFPR